MMVRRLFHWYPTCIASLWLLAELLSAGGLIGGNVYELMIGVVRVLGFPVFMVLMVAMWATPGWSVVVTLVGICPMIWSLVWFTRESKKGTLGASAVCVAAFVRGAFGSQLVCP